MYSTEKDVNPLNLQAESELKEKLRQEAQEAIDQIERGEFVSIDKAFEVAKASYRKHD